MDNLFWVGCERLVKLEMRGVAGIDLFEGYFCPLFVADAIPLAIIMVAPMNVRRSGTSFQISQPNMVAQRRAV